MIKTLNKRYPELGRLRLGEKPVSATKPGKPLDHWRLTSPDRSLLEAMGGLYGVRGEIKPWEKQFELEIDTQEIDVMIPDDSWSVYMEMWSKAGCRRRCDGEVATIPYSSPDGGGLEQADCLCLGEGKQPGIDKDTCNVTGRLKVVIMDAPGVGAWLLTTGSINAALELTAQIDLLQTTGTIPAFGVLAIEHRTLKKPWEKFERSFYVPVLRLSSTLRGLATQALPEIPERVTSEPDVYPADRIARLRADPGKTSRHAADVMALCDDYETLAAAVSRFAVADEHAGMSHGADTDALHDWERACRDLTGTWRRLLGEGDV